MPQDSNQKLIGIIGMGYVGLPLAIEFAKKRKVIGFDINSKRIKELNLGLDTTNEINPLILKKIKNITYTNNKNDLSNVEIFIVTVPTPIDKNNEPDMSFLIKASQLVGKFLKKNDIVIYESTVYPGATEEVCVPEIESKSGLKYNQDFYCGYSPERINPGDKERPISKIKKITSGSNEKTSDEINKLYQSIIEAGTHQVSSIKIAEAAKVIENVQRDVNIGLINEISIIFDKLNIDTHEVLNASKTKWNFLPFSPGLVGGHCIPVDPYYLHYKAKKLNYNTKIISSARKVNNSVAKLISNRTIKLLNKNKINLRKAKILNLGLTFKENCPDLRNSLVVDLIKNLEKKNLKVFINDSEANIEDISQYFNKKKFIELPTNILFDAIIISVPHQKYINMGTENIKSMLKKNGIIFDVKGTFDKSFSNERL